MLHIYIVYNFTVQYQSHLWLLTLHIYCKMPSDEWYHIIASNALHQWCKMVCHQMETNHHVKWYNITDIALSISVKLSYVIRIIQNNSIRSIAYGIDDKYIKWWAIISVYWYVACHKTCGTYHSSMTCVKLDGAGWQKHMEYSFETYNYFMDRCLTKILNA